VSCGQDRGTGETQVGAAIRALLEDQGFDCYVAFQQQSPRSLRENIFSELASSEYFLFVDLRREQFANRAEHRGSLFSHQELAIASYLDLPIIAFQQTGVRQLDGMLVALQVNAIPFEQPQELTDMLRRELKRACWSARCKNALNIERQAGEFDNARVGGPSGRPARFFHLTVRNLNSRKLAFSCTAYLQRATATSNGLPMPLRTVELKWAGYTHPNATILPSSCRDLDACFVFLDQPDTLQFASFSDSSYYLPPMRGPGQFELEYTVVSENFPVARAIIHAEVGRQIEDAKLELPAPVAETRGP